MKTKIGLGVMICLTGLLSTALEAQAKPNERYTSGTIVVLKDSKPGAIPLAASESDWQHLYDARNAGGELGKQAESLMIETGHVYSVRQGTKVMIVQYSILRDLYLVLFINGPHYHDSMWTAPYFLKPVETGSRAGSKSK